MFLRLEDLQRLKIQAVDGEIGSPSDVYVDDERWTVRYLAVRTSWLGREVVISPISVDEPDWGNERLRVALTREQIRNSPDVLEAQPLTRVREAQLAAYYGYPAYWGGPDLWAWAGSPGALMQPPPAGHALPAEPAAESHLISGRDLRGVHIEAADGRIGHVDDLLVDDVSWTARYLLVDTSNWLGGRHVLIPSQWVEGVDWSSRVLSVGVTRERIRTAPDFEADRFDRAAEEALFRHYDRPEYWRSGQEEEQPVARGIRR